MRSFLRTHFAIVSLVGIAALAPLAWGADTASPPAEPRGRAPGAEQSAEPRVRVQSVEVIASPVGPVVVLKLRSKSVPVFVDPVVALSIRGALAGEAPARPLSHDLMRTMLDALGARVTQAVITLKDQVYYAELTVVIGDTKKVFDARSSDAIALALRFKAPIFVDPALVEAAGVEPPPAEPKPNAT